MKPAPTQPMRQSRRPLTRTEIQDRSTGASKTHIRAEIEQLIDEGGLVEHGVKKSDKNGREVPLYVLAKGWGDD